MTTTKRLLLLIFVMQNWQQLSILSVSGKQENCQRYTSTQVRDSYYGNN